MTAGVNVWKNKTKTLVGCFSLPSLLTVRGEPEDWCQGIKAALGNSFPCFHLMELQLCSARVWCSTGVPPRESRSCRALSCGHNKIRVVATGIEVVSRILLMRKMYWLEWLHNYTWEWLVKFNCQHLLYGGTALSSASDNNLGKLCEGILGMNSERIWLDF